MQYRHNPLFRTIGKQSIQRVPSQERHQQYVSWLGVRATATPENSISCLATLQPRVHIDGMIPPPHTHTHTHTHTTYLYFLPTPPPPLTSLYIYIFTLHKKLFLFILTCFYITPKVDDDTYVNYQLLIDRYRKDIYGIMRKFPIVLGEFQGSEKHLTSKGRLVVIIYV